MATADRPPGTFPAGREPVDISDTDQLIRFAARAQILLATSGEVGRTRSTQAGIARAAGVAPSNLSSALNKAMPTSLIQKLDVALAAVIPDAPRFGGLVGLATRLTGDEIVEVAIPPAWLEDLLSLPLELPSAVLLQSSALLSSLRVVEQETGYISATRAYDVSSLIRRLVQLGTLPYGGQSDEALVLLGRLSTMFFQSARPHLMQALRGPLGHKVWPIADFMTGRVAERSASSELPYWWRLQFQDMDDLRRLSVNPTHTLDIEAAASTPILWALEDTDWAMRAIWRRAESHETTHREVGAALASLWMRAQARRTSDEVLDRMERLLDQRIADSMRLDQSAQSELRWYRDVIHVFERERTKVIRSWPRHHSCVRLIGRASKHLGVPEQIADDLRVLLEHALLQSMTFYRHRAIDVIKASGWGRQVAPVLQRVLDDATAERWLRARCISALGGVAPPDPSTHFALLDAYHGSMTSYRRHPLHPQEDGVEVQAALFAIIDAFSMQSYSAVEEIRRSVERDLWDLFETEPALGDRATLLQRAALYFLLTMGESTGKTSLELPMRSSDPVVRQLAVSLSQRREDMDAHDPWRSL